ncbi:hypothetical protein SAY87_031891 [Trapa incisa]|uniref:BAH domain-containing protein n=1 Tax=Trapa incisa TaxID=236973 RepID=A0AAN7KU40_9MYRT|nr:hypothetical protein SAY87_031891 [Trapa incisa]
MKMLVEVPQKENGKRKVHSSEYVTYDGVVYNLHDYVILYQHGKTETYIGKIIEIIDTPHAGKQVKVVWFFRPSEIRNYLGDYKPRWNEIFLASGDGQGLSNTNLLDGVTAKCTVVCTSKDKRNHLPSKKQLRSADYIFRCTFDVGKLKISRKFPNKIYGIKVENFFNTRTGGHLRLMPTQTPHLSYREGNSKKPQEKMHSGLSVQRAKRLFLENFSSSESLKLERMKKIRFSEVETATAHQRVEVMLEAPNEVSSQVEQDQATNRENDTERSWLKKMITPWEERLPEAEKEGTLVLLENLDPTYSSSEIEEMVLSVFNERVQAKMMAQTPFSCPLYGKAFVIFKSKDAANTVICKLDRGCLMLTDQRPVVGSAGILKKPEESKLFTGHYEIRMKRQTEDERTAVATAHCSQKNTLEYGMAMKWRLLQEKTRRWWKQLHENQMKEILELKKQLKINI